MNSSTYSLLPSSTTSSTTSSSPSSASIWLSSFNFNKWTFSLSYSFFSHISSSIPTYFSSVVVTKFFSFPLTSFKEKKPFFTSSTSSTQWYQFPKWFPYPLSKSKSKLIYYDFHEIPKHLQDNQFVLHKYRAFYTSFECFQSIFSFHNETLNIWTHFIASCFFLSCILKISSSSSSFPPSSPFSSSSISNNNMDPTTLTSATISSLCYYDPFALSFYLFTAMLCFLLSTIFHTWHCHHQLHVFDTVCIMDYTGIGLLLLGSSTSLIYFVRPPQVLFPLLFSTLPCCLALIVPWIPILRHHKLRKLRTLILFGLASICMCVVLVTLSQVYQHHQSLGYSWLSWGFASMLSYCIGTFIYVFQLPERWYPGKFDLLGSSHQFWHLLAATGVYCHFQVLLHLQSSTSADVC